MTDPFRGCSPIPFLMRISALLCRRYVNAFFVRLSTRIIALSASESVGVFLSLKNRSLILYNGGLLIIFILHNGYFVLKLRLTDRTER
jgi:hypothetical protein